MGRILKVPALALLVAALLNATSGLCFCPPGDDASPSRPDSHACCHGPAEGSRQAARSAVPCCSIETAPSDMTPTHAVPVGQPPTMVVATHVDTTAHALVGQPGRCASAPSPPIHALRL